MTYPNFWDHHGLFFLLFITLFPRLTLLFSSVATGGFFWWIGFIFAPRLLVAILATVTYLQSNPILVIASWVVALSGETSEKYAMKKRVRIIRFGGGPGGFQRPSGSPEHPIKDAKVIDVDYKRLD